nr:BRCT domain-containing protein [uncultured Flavobacterium sp.]
MDEKTLQIITSKSQADKAINSLKGILLGINLDKVVNSDEIHELKNWVKKHHELVLRNPFREFMLIIDSIAEEDLGLTETIEDLFWLCQKYEGDNYYYNAVTTDLQTLQGLCHGILADGEITDKEIFDLDKWLDDNEHLNTYYPYDEIRSLVLSIVSDGKITEDERLVLKAYFSQFVNLANNDIQQKIKDDTKEVNISGLCTSEPIVNFDGKTFCITGVLKNETKESLNQKITNLGGLTTDSVTKKTDYLIVADNGNPAWAFSCYGRKVEKAVNMRKDGHVITLIHEFDLYDAIEDFGTN